MWQVREMRRMLGKPLDQAQIHLDGSGLKQLFSWGLRRFKTQQYKTRVTRQQ